MFSEDKSTTLEIKSHNNNCVINGVACKKEHRIYKDGDYIDNYDAQCAICM